jgi:catechol 2,3-dioxygenase-like lactoylglutathione lyase family enzyme
MSTTLEFIALHVPDLRQAEEYYRALFEMEVITREAPMQDDVWYAVPEGKGWADLERAGIELGMLALRRDDFVLALFRGDPAPGQVFALGLSMGLDEIAALYHRLPSDSVVEYDAGRMLHFRDPHEYFWQVYASPYEFQSIGRSAGRWMSLP